MLEQYRQFRNDAIRNARFYKYIGDTDNMLRFVKQAKNWQTLIIRFHENEKEERELVNGTMAKYGIVRES